MLETIASNEPPPPAYQERAREKSFSLDVTQRFERKLAQYNASNNVFKRWCFEIVCVATSAACMAIIVAAFVAMQNKPLKDYAGWFTFVTFLSKVASAALIVPISEAIGQLKWIWFQGKNSRDAYDFEIFDKASRGAWGSFLLLVRTKGKSLAAFGAFLTILLLMIDTFFQQVTELPQRWALHGNSSISRAITFEAETTGELQDGVAWLVTNQAISYTADAYFSSNGTIPIELSNGTRPEVPVSCPTGRCTWPRYQTLGVCSQCVLTTELLTFACLDAQIDWKLDLLYNSTKSNGTMCGYFLNATTPNPILMSGSMVDEKGQYYGDTLIMRTIPLVTIAWRKPLWGGSINFKEERSPIVNVIISSNADKSEVQKRVPPTIQECVLKWCVKTVESSYILGSYQETILETFSNTTASEKYLWNSSYDEPSSSYTFDYFEDPSIYAPPLSGGSATTRWGVSNNTMASAARLFDNIFPSFTVVTDSETFLKWKTGSTKFSYTRRLPFNPWLAPNNISLHMTRMATSLTNIMRSAVDGTSHVMGQAFVEETFVDVRWPWLAFPLAMLALSLFFLVATMIRTSEGSDAETGHWKTSAMPTLVYGLPQEARETLTSTSSWRTARRANRGKVKIRLMPNKGWRVSGLPRTAPVLPTRTQRDIPLGWL